MRRSGGKFKSIIYFEREYDFSLGLTAVKSKVKNSLFVQG